MYIPDPSDTGAAGAAGSTSEQSSSTEPLWKRRGFKDEQALEAALESYSKDTPALRNRLKDAEAKAAEYDKVVAEREKQQQATMSEADKARKEAEDWKRKHETALSELAKRDQALLFERTAAARLAGVPAKDQKPLRRLYETVLVKGFADSDELKASLDAIDAEWLESNPAGPNPNTPDPARQPAVGATVTGGHQDRTTPAGTYDQSYMLNLDKKMSRRPK